MSQEKEEQFRQLDPNDNRTPAQLIADGENRWANSGTIYIPKNVLYGPTRELARFVRTLLRLEAVLDDRGELNERRNRFTRASGQVRCRQCHLLYCEHPNDIAGESDVAGSTCLTILCDKSRVKL
jgi:hypothetical protein